jgi:toxin ParE1/3/4
MAKIIWTNNALQDIEEIAVFIERDSPYYAKVTIQGIFNYTKILTDQPRLGRMVPEVGHEDLRELIRGNYRIIYKVSLEKIYIVTIHHSSRDLALRSIFELE